MGKSLDYIVERIEGGYIGGISDFDDLAELHGGIFRNDCTKECHCIIEYENGKKRRLSVLYDPYADFDYAIYKSLLSDGCAYYSELVKGIVAELVSSYCTVKVNSDFKVNYENYESRYTVGNFVFGLKNDSDFGTEEKPWLTMRQTLFLPVKFECWPIIPELENV